MMHSTHSVGASQPSLSLLSQRRVREDFDVQSQIPLCPPFSKGDYRMPVHRLHQTAISIVIAILLSLSLPPLLSAQSKPLKEIRVPYALGGSTSFFWVAQRSGSFEKYGLKVLPIFMRGGREAVQALISRDVTMLQQGSSGVILAWAQGAKDLVVLGATGNKLDYVFVSRPQHQEAGGSQRQENRHQPVGRQHRFHRPPGRAPARSQ